MIRLALARHGHTAWNRAGQIQGRTDIPLDADAVEHLRTLKLPSPWDTCDLVASPLARACQTAELISDRTPVLVPELTEMDWGTWEGQRGEELIAESGSGYRHIEDWGWNYRPPEGESPAEVRDRLLPWAAGLTRDTVAVCHIGIMRVLMAHATGWGFEGPPPFRIKRDRLFIIRINGSDWEAEDVPVRLETRNS